MPLCCFYYCLLAFLLNSTCLFLSSLSIDPASIHRLQGLRPTRNNAGNHFQRSRLWYVEQNEECRVMNLKPICRAKSCSIFFYIYIYTLTMWVVSLCYGFKNIMVGVIVQDESPYSAVHAPTSIFFFYQATFAKHKPLWQYQTELI